MESSKDPGKPASIMALIISILGIILTIIEKLTIEAFVFLLVLTICAIVMTFLSFYVKTTNKNSEDIEEIKQNFKFADRLNKLEIKMGYLENE
jgi:lysylphosphatidylglycerol synthetase-like protein (DUF2156 family)